MIIIVTMKIILYIYDMKNDKMENVIEIVFVNREMLSLTVSVKYF